MPVRLAWAGSLPSAAAAASRRAEVSRAASESREGGGGRLGEKTARFAPRRRLYFRALNWK